LRSGEDGKGRDVEREKREEESEGRFLSEEHCGGGAECVR